MLKTIIKYKLIILLLILTTNSNSIVANSSLTSREIKQYEQYIKQPKQISIDSFLTINAHIESRNQSDIINRFGCIGKYQFKLSSIKDLGYKINEKKIKKSIKTVKNEYFGYDLRFNDKYLSDSLQDEIIKDYLITVEHKYLTKSIKKYVGKKIKGIRITKAGVLSASFLGYRYVYLFLSSNGKINHKDGNGHSVSDRLKLFQNVEIDSDEIVGLL